MPMQCYNGIKTMLKISINIEFLVMFSCLIIIMIYVIIECCWIIINYLAALNSFLLYKCCYGTIFNGIYGLNYLPHQIHKSIKVC